MRGGLENWKAESRIHHEDTKDTNEEFGKRKAESGIRKAETKEE